MNKIKSTILALTSVSALAGLVNAQTVPYTPEGATGQLFNFDGGEDNTVAAELEPGLLTINYDPATGSSGGWNLTAIGSVNVAGLATAQATAKTGAGFLAFGTQSGGFLGDVVDADLISKWEANTTILGSSTWAGVGDTVTYNFTLDRGNGVLNLGAGVIPDLTLVISDAAGVLYEAADGAALLGLANLSNSQLTTSASFVYGRAPVGDLTVKWAASQLATANLLGNGEEVYKISNSSMTVTPVPEPSSTFLAGLGALGLLALRRR